MVRKRISPRARSAERVDLGEAQKAKISKSMHEWGAGTLHSGGPSGPVVPHTKKGQKQALAIGYSEGRRLRRRKKGKH